MAMLICQSKSHGEIKQNHGVLSDGIFLCKRNILPGVAPHLGFPAMWKAIHSDTCPSALAEIVCNASVSPHIPRNTCQTQSSPESSYFLIDDVPKYLLWKGKMLRGDWQSSGKFGARSHTVSIVSNSIGCDTHPPVFVFTFPEQHHAQAVILPQSLASLLPFFAISLYWKR